MPAAALELAGLVRIEEEVAAGQRPGRPGLDDAASSDVIDADSFLLDVTPAAVTHCSRKSLPENPRDAMRLIHDVHKSFFDRAAGPNFETLDFTTALSD